MTIEQSGLTTGEQAETAEELCLLLRADDGATYAIPQAALEGYRLSDAQRAELEAHLGADGTDVQGYYNESIVNRTNTGNVGRFSPTHPVIEWGWPLGWGKRIVPQTGDAYPDYHPPVR